MLIRIAIATLGIFLGTFAQAQSPEPGSRLPLLAIEDRGELVLEGDDIMYRPWSSEHNPGSVHIVQYFAGTRSASAVFSPFTDSLKSAFAYTDYHITTIINLDAATWGTGRLVISEVEDNKREYPLATMVLDKTGAGVGGWGLNKKGAALVILDKEGTVLQFFENAMTENQLVDMLTLVGKQIDS